MRVSSSSSSSKDGKKKGVGPVTFSFSSSSFRHSGGISLEPVGGGKQLLLSAGEALKSWKIDTRCFFPPHCSSTCYHGSSECSRPADSAFSATDLDRVPSEYCASHGEGNTHAAVYRFDQKSPRPPPTPITHSGDLDLRLITARACGDM